MNEPMPSALSGAIHHRRELRNTILTPRHVERPPSVRGGAGVSGTNMKITAATASVVAPSTANMARHDSTDNAQASGAVESRAPMPPATIIHPASDAWRSAE